MDGPCAGAEEVHKVSVLAARRRGPMGATCLGLARIVRWWPRRRHGIGDALKAVSDVRVLCRAVSNVVGGEVPVHFKVVARRSVRRWERRGPHAEWPRSVFFNGAVMRVFC